MVELAAVVVVVAAAASGGVGGGAAAAAAVVVGVVVVMITKRISYQKSIRFANCTYVQKHITKQKQKTTDQHQLVIPHKS